MSAAEGAAEGRADISRTGFVGWAFLAVAIADAAARWLGLVAHRPEFAPDVRLAMAVTHTALIAWPALLILGARLTFRSWILIGAIAVAGVELVGTGLQDAIDGLPIYAPDGGPAGVVLFLDAAVGLLSTLIAAAAWAVVGVGIWRVVIRPSRLAQGVGAVAGLAVASFVVSNLIGSIIVGPQLELFDSLGDSRTLAVVPTNAYVLPSIPWIVLGVALVALGLDVRQRLAVRVGGLGLAVAVAVVSLAGTVAIAAMFAKGDLYDDFAAWWLSPAGWAPALALVAISIGVRSDILRE